jgi:hypothetical protein
VEEPLTPDPYAEHFAWPRDRRRHDPRAFGREGAAQDALASTIHGDKIDQIWVDDVDPTGNGANAERGLSRGAR